MEESDTKKCTNCNRDIPKDNFEIHSVHCVRNIRNCAVCTEPVPITLMQEHIERMHSMLNCPRCREQVRGADMEDHIRDSCSLTLQTCRYCSLDMARVELPRHEDYCGSRTEECPDCKKYIMMKYRGIHLDSNHTFVKLPEEEEPRAPLQPILSSSPRYLFQRGSLYCSPQQFARIQSIMGIPLPPEDLRLIDRPGTPIREDIASDDSQLAIDEPEPSTSDHSARSLRRPLEGAVSGASQNESVNTSPVPRKVTKRAPNSADVKVCTSVSHHPGCSHMKETEGETSKHEEEEAIPSEEEPPQAPLQDLSHVLPPEPSLHPFPTVHVRRRMRADGNERVETLFRGPRGRMNYTPMTGSDFMQRFRLLQLRPDGPEDNNNDGLSISNPELPRGDRYGNIRRELSALRRNLNQVTAQASTFSGQLSSSSQSAPVTPAIGDVYIPCEICGFPCNPANLAMHQSICEDVVRNGSRLSLQVDLDGVPANRGEEQNGILLPCEFCNQLIDIHQLDGHQQTCRNIHAPN